MKQEAFTWVRNSLDNVHKQLSDLLAEKIKLGYKIDQVITTTSTINDRGYQNVIQSAVIIATKM